MAKKFVYDYTAERKRKTARRARSRPKTSSKRLVACLIVIIAAAVLAIGVSYSGISFNVSLGNENNDVEPQQPSNDFVPEGDYTLTNANIDEEYINGFLVRYQEYPGSSCSNEIKSCVSYIAGKMGMSESLVSKLYYFRCTASTCYAKPQRILNR